MNITYTRIYNILYEYTIVARRQHALFPLMTANSNKILCIVYHSRVVCAERRRRRRIIIIYATSRRSGLMCGSRTSECVGSFRKFLHKTSSPLLAVYRECSDLTGTPAIYHHRRPPPLHHHTTHDCNHGVMSPSFYYYTYYIPGMVNPWHAKMFTSIYHIIL